MPPWVQTVLVLCVVTLTAVLVPVVLALGRAARRTETVLAILEQELRPLVGQAHALAGDLRDLSKEAKSELERIGAVTEQVSDLSRALARLVSVLGGLTRAGQLIGVATGIRKGFDVFVRQLKK